MPPNPEKAFPNRSEEEQSVELEPVLMGPGAYASPEPATSHNVMYPAVDDPHSTAAVAADRAAALRSGETGSGAASYKKMKKDELQAEAESRGIEGASDMKKDELVEALEDHDFDNTTVEQLQERASALEIEGTSSMNKEELFDAVREAEAERGQSSGAPVRMSHPAATTGVPDARPSAAEVEAARRGIVAGPEGQREANQS